MKTQHCCHDADQKGDNTLPSASYRRRGVEIVKWIIPSAALALLPKCPICVAMYVALFSGVGISVTSAAILRTSLLILCVSALLFLALNRIYRLTVAKSPFNSHALAYGVQREKTSFPLRKKSVK